MTKTVTVLSGLIRPLVENRLPGWVERKRGPETAIG